MCGRYGFTNSDKEKVKKAFRLKKIDFDLVPRYNIAPGQDVSVILNEMPEELTIMAPENWTKKTVELDVLYSKTQGGPEWACVNREL